MKKLLFLLLMTVVLSGFLFAETSVHPPGEFSLDITSEISIHENAIISDSVLEFVPPATMEQSIIQTVSAQVKSTIAVQPYSNEYRMMLLRIKQTEFKSTDYYLRC